MGVKTFVENGKSAVVVATQFQRTGGHGRCVSTCKPSSILLVVLRQKLHERFSFVQASFANVPLAPLASHAILTSHLPVEIKSTMRRISADEPCFALPIRGGDHYEDWRSLRLSLFSFVGSLSTRRVPFRVSLVPPPSVNIRLDPPGLEKPHFLMSFLTGPVLPNPTRKKCIFENLFREHGREVRHLKAPERCLDNFLAIA